MARRGGGGSWGLREGVMLVMGSRGGPPSGPPGVPLPGPRALPGSGYLLPPPPSLARVTHLTGRGRGHWGARSGLSENRGQGAG